MTPFRAVSARAVAIDRANVDTDVLIPINRLIGTPPAELGRFLFEPWRYLGDGQPDPDFPLNQPRYAGAEVLVAGENFGCGSSREHAVWALASFGIRCVVAPSFGDIFRQNCYQNGVLPVTLDAGTVAGLMDEIVMADAPVVGVDLEAQIVTFPRGRVVEFVLDEERRQALLLGLDDIGITLTRRSTIEQFESDDVVLRPWKYRTEEVVTIPQVLVLAGDGVGAEIMPEVRRVIDWFVAERGLVLDLDERPFGIRAWHEHGTLMRDETWQRILDADAIRRDARKHGLARVEGHLMAGISGLAAPILAHDGSAAMVLTAFGTQPLFDARWNGKVAQTLRAIASEASRRLGPPV